MHKELLVREFLQKYLPPGLLVGRGFVKPGGTSEWPSREVDVLICDPQLHAPFFWEGGLLVTPPRSVRAHIEVKSTYSTTVLAEALDNQRNVQASLENLAPKAWRGVLFFSGPTVDDESSLDRIAGNIAEALSEIREKGDGTTTLLPTAICVLNAFVAFVTAGQDDETGRVKLFAQSGLEAACFFADLLTWLRPHGDRSDFDEMIERCFSGIRTSKTIEVIAN